ncbi:hypothetical protein [Fructobacillus tropaeoli]|uniref:hypothetical protein n=1 Tax=Fructobacillus tropaeoli TaxID=709323 RepID=UPI002D84CE91|nr:unnamed protein product [Fructobacillus tropaeoli]
MISILFTISFVLFIAQLIYNLVPRPQNSTFKDYENDKTEVERERPAINIPVEWGPLFNFELEGKTVAEWRKEHGLPDKKDV